MRTPRRRSEDGPRGFLTKLAASVLAAIVVGAVGWNFSTLLDHGRRLAYIEYYLKWKGVLPP